MLKAAALTLALLVPAVSRAGDPLSSEAAARPGEPAAAPPATVAWPGRPAPPLTVSAWVRGTPIRQFEPGHVYVVDLWSLWCRPCLASMPALRRLEQRYADDATFVAMNIWEMSPKKVPAYVASRGDSMVQTVAMDSIPPGKEVNEGLTASVYLGTSEVVSIPKAFVIDRQGRVVWIGDPKDLEDPLQQVLRGTWEIDPFAMSYAAEQAREERLRQALAPIEKAIAAADWDSAYRACENRVAADSTIAGDLARMGFANLAYQVLVAKNAGAADLKVALRAAERAIELEQEPDWSLHELAGQAAQRAGDVAAARRHFEIARDKATGKDRATVEAELKSLQ